MGCILGPWGPMGSHGGPWGPMGSWGPGDPCAHGDPWGPICPWGPMEPIVPGLGALGGIVSPSPSRPSSFESPTYGFKAISDGFHIDFQFCGCHIK